MSRTGYSPKFPHVGSNITWNGPDNHTVTVQRLDHTYTVTTVRGTTVRLHAMCSTHATEQEACDAARACCIAIREAAITSAVDALISEVGTITGGDTHTTHTTEPSRFGSVATAPVLRPVAKGRQMHMSESQAYAILAAGPGGKIRRGMPTVDGMPTGQLTGPQMEAAQSRLWVKITYDEKVTSRPVSCTPTELGVTRAREILSRS